MELTKTLDGTKATIAVSGKLSVATAPDLEAAVQELATSTVDFDIDLTELEYISSAGLRVLVSTQKLSAQRGGVMRLLNPTEDVMEVFEMTGLSDVFTIEK